MVSLPPIVNYYVQGNEEGFEIHAPPFGPGCGGGGGEIRVRPNMLLPRADSAGQVFALDRSTKTGRPAKARELATMRFLTEHGHQVDEW